MIFQNQKYKTDFQGPASSTAINTTIFKTNTLSVRESSRAHWKQHKNASECGYRYEGCGKILIFAKKYAYVSYNEFIFKMAATYTHTNTHTQNSTVSQGFVDLGSRADVIGRFTVNGAAIGCIQGYGQFVRRAPVEAFSGKNT